MTKKEFEELAGISVSENDYSVIEMVYTWHPVISNVSGKEEVAELYKSFGMTIFYDMVTRAERAFDLDKLLREAKGKVASIKQEIEELSCGFVKKRETLPVDDS